MTSGVIATISRSDLPNLAAKPAEIIDFKELASYTWWNKSSPTISVPGFPPLWFPPSAPRRLDPDSGIVYIDQNAARSPASPLEPLFRAILIERPDFSLSDVDLVTDRNNIRKLLRFVQALSSDPFHIRVEVVGHGTESTALFTRVEPKTTDFIREFRGYGHSFEKAYTKTPVAGVTGYHRIVGYNFGGMRCIVRHETDAYVRERNTEGVDDSLLSALEGLSLSEPEKMASGLAIMRSRNKTDVGVSSTLEIKTCAASRSLDMAGVLPQLWISQTPKLAVGYHRRGVFENVRVRDMTREILQWEAANQGDLKKLAGLLAEIIRVVKRASDCRVMVEYTGGASLRIVAGDGKPALPEDLYAKWNDNATLEEEVGFEAGKGKENVTSTAHKEPSGKTKQPSC